MVLKCSLDDFVGLTCKVTYDDAGEIRVLRGKLTGVYGYVTLELPDGHKFMVNMQKVERILEIDEEREKNKRKGVTVIE